MTQINLYDKLNLNFSKKEITVLCDHPSVPEGESNIAYKAADLFFHSLKATACKDHTKGICIKPKGICIKPKGICIKIDKKIPPGGGLGGGSSNAAIVLTALNDYYKNPFSKPQLMEMGLTLGADVPFFIFNNPAIAKGVGEKLEKIENLKHYYLVLCDPGIPASTAKVYKNIDFKLTTKQKYNINNGLGTLLWGMGGMDFDIRNIMHNDLKESTYQLYPEIRKVSKEMELLLERKVFMTGSGSSVFALFTKYADACKAYEKLLTKWNKSRKKVFLSSFKNKRNNLKTKEVI